MNLLALDTCFDATSVAVLDTASGDIVARFEPMKTGHAERLIPMIAEVIDEAGIEMTSVDRVAVTVGPGTFTGTRISVAVARSLSLALDCPVVCETSLAVIAEAHACRDASCVMAATDARRGEVYCQVFHGTPPMADSDPRVQSVAEAADGLRIEPRPLVVGTAAPAITEALVVAGLAKDAIIVRSDALPDARHLAIRAARNEDAMACRPTPLYLRPADAKPSAGSAIARA